LAAEDGSAGEADVDSGDLAATEAAVVAEDVDRPARGAVTGQLHEPGAGDRDRKSTRLNSSHDQISYAVFCLKKKKKSYVTLTNVETKEIINTIVIQHVKT